MLSKKLAIAAASAALVLGAMAPMAFADVTVDNHGGVMVGGVTTSANSGANGVVLNGEDDLTVSGVNVTTGPAVASTNLNSVVNNNLVTVTNSGNGDEGSADVNLTNCGFVTVEDVTTLANSGVNGVSTSTDDSTVTGVNVTSGAATAGTGVSSLVNVNQVTVTNSGNDGSVE